MAEFTPYKGLNVPAAGTPNWDVPANIDWRSIDQAIAGSQWINAAGFTGSVYLTNAYPSGSTDPATALSCLPSTIVIYGAITGQINLAFPNNLPGHWIIRNATSGNFPVYAVNATGAYNFLSLPQNVVSHVHTDGNSFFFVGASGTASQLAMVGEIKAFAGGYQPAGWLICDGRWLNRVTYVGLFNVFGYAYGGNGADAFALPDLRGRVIAGSDTMGTIGNANRLYGWGITAASGVSSMALSTNELPVHTHYDYGHGHGASQDPHAHTVGGNAVTGGGGNVGVAAPAWAIGPVITDTRQPGVGIAAGYANLTNAGAGAAFSIVQPTIVLHYIIYSGV